MTIRALTGIAPDWFTPASEKGNENPARFKIKPLNLFQKADLLPEVNIDTMTVSGRGMRMALQHGLVGWENVVDDKGKALKLSMSTACALPDTILTEVIGAIVSASMLGAEEAKNS